MFSFRPTACVVCSILLLAPALAPRLAGADEVIFKNGDRVSGTVTRGADGKITITGSVFGTVTADESEVASISATTAPTTRPAGTTATSEGAIASTRPTDGAATRAVAATAPTTAPTTLATSAPSAAPAAAPAPPQPKRWSGSVTGTALATRGNSETDSVRAAFDAKRQGEGNVLSLGAAYAFGRTTDPTTGDASTTTDNWFTQGKFDHSLGERWYDYALLRVEADYVADLDLRVTPGVGFGYRWINKPEEHFNTEAGITWVYELYDDGGDNEHFAVRLAYHYDRKLNDRVSIVQNLEYLPNIVDPGDFNLNADIGLRTMMTKSLFVELRAEWRHDSTPAPGADHNDERYIMGVGWNF